METLNILLVEDNEAEYSACQAAVKYLFRAKICEIKLKRCTSVTEVECVWKGYCKDLWANSGKKFFDGAIIDLHLKNDAPGHIGGNEVIQKLEELTPRVPLVIRSGMTAHRAEELRHVYCVDRLSDEAKFENLLTRFLNIRKTGLIDIMSGSGEIDKKMNIIFQKVLMPQIDSWIDYAKDAADENTRQKVEKALLRYSMNHLLDHLDQENEEYYPEEFYLTFSTENNADKIRTGNILKTDSEELYVIMNPICDLAVRSDGEFKASHILLAKVDALTEAVGDNETTTDAKRKKTLHSLCTQPPNHRYCLPSTKSFRGGMINFSILKSIAKEEFKSSLSSYEIVCQISPHFMKDMVAKFGAGYSRQGQPEVRTDDFLRHYLNHRSLS